MDRVSLRTGDEKVGLLANGAAGPWDVSIDETISGAERWFAQVEGRGVDLSFEIASLEIVPKIIRFLAPLRANGEYGTPGASERREDELPISKAGGIPVTLVRDDEYEDRYFIVVGATDAYTSRLSLAGDDIHHLVDALRQAQEEIEMSHPQALDRNNARG